jgi:hypothetical protein
MSAIEIIPTTPDVANTSAMQAKNDSTSHFLPYLSRRIGWNDQYLLYTVVFLGFIGFWHAIGDQC